MALPDYSMRQLLEAGVHFGHQSHRWNPKMGHFIFGARNNIHIIDLAQTVPLLHRALEAVSDTVAKGGRILFVGTKRQAQDAVAEAAKKSAQYYVNSRWLGGTLTNWKTISESIKRLRKLEEMLGSGEAQAYTKKERLTLTRERDKLDRALGGIKDMGGLPDLVFVIDTNKEDIAIKEARRLNIPVAAVVDTNCDPDGITFVVPGNDDAGRAITLYCDLIAKAAIDGISRAQGDLGIDIGAAERPIVEDMPRRGEPTGSASKPCRDRAASPTTSRNCPACRRRSRRSSTISAFSIIGRSPASVRRRPTMSEKKWACRAASTAGSPTPRNSAPSSRHALGVRARSGRSGRVPRPIASVLPGTLPGQGIEFVVADANRIPTMANISAQMVKELRDKTGAGMMDCKAALADTQGDMEGAVDWLRKKGLAKAAKKAGRVAAEGLIGVAVAGTKGVVVEVNSETDFVARNEQFQGLVRMIADIALDVGTDIEKIKAAKVGGVTANDAINSAIATIGENMTLRRAAQVVGRRRRDRDLCPQCGDRRARQDRRDRRAGIVGPGRRAGGARASGRDACGGVQSRRPSTLPGSTPQVVAREKDILADKFRAQGKPEAMIAKIVEFGLKTFYKEACLLDQPYIHDPDKTVAQALKEAEGKVGGPIKVAGFVRYALGEGIDRQGPDFASEVAAAAGH